MKNQPDLCDEYRKLGSPASDCSAHGVVLDEWLELISPLSRHGYASLLTSALALKLLGPLLIRWNTSVPQVDQFVEQIKPKRRA